MRKPTPKNILIFALLVLAAVEARAAGSNIALSEYPGPSCTKPQVPIQPQQPQNQNAASTTAEAFKEKVLKNEVREEEAYNAKVLQYNKAVTVYNSAVKDFNSCMQTYVENGNADMTRIKQRLDQAVADANARQ